MSLHKKKSTRKILRIQRAANKKYTRFRDLTYEKRLERLCFTTLKDRRGRGNQTAIYKVMKKMETVGGDDLLVWNARKVTGRN